MAAADMEAAPGQSPATPGSVQLPQIPIVLGVIGDARDPAGDLPPPSAPPAGDAPIGRASRGSPPPPRPGTPPPPSVGFHRVARQPPVGGSVVQLLRSNLDAAVTAEAMRIVDSLIAEMEEATRREARRRFSLTCAFGQHIAKESHARVAAGVRAALRERGLRDAVLTHEPKAMPPGVRMRYSVDGAAGCACSVQ